MENPTQHQVSEHEKLHIMGKFFSQLWSLADKTQARDHLSDMEMIQTVSQFLTEYIRTKRHTPGEPDNA